MIRYLYCGNWLRNIEKRKELHIAFMDLEKGYDKVDKFKYLGVMISTDGRGIGSQGA